MPVRCAIVVLLAALDVACAPTVDTRDDAAVLRAVLDRQCANDAVPLTIVSNEPAELENKPFPAEWPLAAEYERQLASRPAPASAWALGEICGKVHVIARHDIQATFADDIRIPPGWEKFFATFEGARGWSAYSRPLYSKDGRHAAMLVSYHCGELCGGGILIELDRIGGRWRAMRSVTRWTS